MTTTIAAVPLLALVFSISCMCGGVPVSDDHVVQLPVKNDPTISFRIWFAVGSQNDPKGKEGLADITASMLTDAATKNNSYEEILDKLFPLAAGYSATTSVEMTVITGRVHKDNLQEFLPLFIDAILRPAFRQDDLERTKSQAVSYLENSLRYSSDEELGKAVLYAELFAGTPYGHGTTGLVEGVKSITLKDVEEFYRLHYTRDNVIIGIGGGFEPGVPRRIREELGALPPGNPSRVPTSVPKILEGFHVAIVEKDAPATAMSMGFPIDLLRGAKDWYALAIANSWLGEHRNSSSHLYQVIREARGLNYGDYSYIENFPGGGMLSKPPQNVSRRQQIFEIWIRPVPNEGRHFALRAALREVKRLIEDGMSEAEFSHTRSFLKKYVLQYAPSTMERLGYALDDRFYGIAGSHLETFRTMMDQLTLADVNAAIKKHLQYGKMQIAIVTKDANSLKQSLLTDAPSPITYKTPKPSRILDVDKEIGVFPLKIKPENLTVLQVKDCFER
jgi:zinc protease